MQIIANFLKKKDTIKQGMTSLFWYAFYEDFSVLPCSSWWALQLNNFHPLNVPPHGFFLCTSKMKYKQKLSKTRKCSQEVFIEIVSLRTNKSRSLNDMCYILSTSVYMYFYFIIGLAQQKQWPGTLKVMSNWKIYSFTHHFQWCLINTHARGKDNVFLAFFLQSFDEPIQPGSKSEKLLCEIWIWNSQTSKLSRLLSDKDISHIEFRLPYIFVRCLAFLEAGSFGYIRCQKYIF